MAASHDPVIAMEVWTSYITAINEHDVDAVVRCVDEQMVYDERPMTMTEPLCGHTQIRAYWQRLLGGFPDLSIAVDTLDAGGRLGFCESTMTGTQTGRMGRGTPSGRSMSVRVACAFEVSGGLLTHERLYWDRANTLRQFGLIRSLVGLSTNPVWRPTPSPTSR